MNGQVLSGSKQQTGLHRENRGFSCENPRVDEPAEVKRRKWWKSKKSSSSRWSCPEVVLDNVSTAAPPEVLQSTPKPSRFSRFKKSLHGTRKERSRRLKKHNSFEDILEDSNREKTIATVPQLVAVNGAEESVCWSQSEGRSEWGNGQVHRRAHTVSHDDLLHRVDLEGDPSTCSIGTETSTEEVHVKGPVLPNVEYPTVHRRRNRLKRLWDSLH